MLLVKHRRELLLLLGSCLCHAVFKSLPAASTEITDKNKNIRETDNREDARAKTKMLGECTCYSMPNTNKQKVTKTRKAVNAKNMNII